MKTFYLLRLSGDGIDLHGPYPAIDGVDKKIAEEKWSNHTWGEELLVFEFDGQVPPFDVYFPYIPNDEEGEGYH